MAALPQVASSSNSFLTLTQLPVGQTIEVLDNPISGRAGHPDTIERGPDYHPIDLGLKPISDYEYHIAQRNSIIRKEYDSIEKMIQEAGLTMPSGDTILQMANERVEKVVKIIEDLKAGSTPCYFLDNSNPFVALVQPDGQIWWRSIYGNGGLDVKQIVLHVTRRKQSIIINSGSHGGTDGSIVCDSDVRGDGYFFVMDAMILALHNPKVAVHQVERGKGPNYKETANHAIDAWCHSILGMFTSPTHLYSFDGTREPSDYRDVTGEVMTNPYHFPICGELAGRVHYYDSRTIQKLRRLLPSGTTTTVCRVYGCGKTINLDDAKPVMGLKHEIERFLSIKAQETAEKTARQAEIARLTAKSDQDDTTITTLQGDKAALEGQVAEDAQIITQTRAERDTAREERRDAVELSRIQADQIEEKDQQLDQAQVQNRQQDQEIRQLSGRVHEIDRREGNEENPAIRRENQLVRKMLTRHGYALIKSTMESQMVSAKAGLAHRLQGGVVSWLMPLSYERATAFVESGVPDRRQIENTNALATLFLDRNKGPVKQKALDQMAFHSLNPKRGSSSAITFDGFEFSQFVSPMMNQLLSTDSVSGRLILELKGNEVHLREIIMEPHRWSTEKEDYGLVFEAATYKEVLTYLFGQCLRYEFAKRINEVADIVDRV